MKGQQLCEAIADKGGCPYEDGPCGDCIHCLAIEAARQLTKAREAAGPFIKLVAYADELELADDDHVECPPIVAGAYRRLAAILQPEPTNREDCGNGD